MFKLLLATTCAYIYAVQSQYYVGIRASVNWYDAERACREGVYIKATGGKLATWSDYNQYNGPVKAAYNALGGGGNNAWIGLNDLGNGQYGGSGSEGDWHFVDGRNCGGTCLPKSAVGNNGLDAWSAGEPNDVNNEDCAEMWGNKDRAGNNYGLNDAGCGNGRNFICEFTNLVTPSGVGKQDVDGPINNPLDNPSGGNNYYIMEFTSIKDIIFFASVILNMVLITMVCYLGSKRCNIKSRTARYSKVDMYATEDEKL